jgi:uncharacterized protein
MYSENSIAEALSPRALELIILPTEKCNFRCTYCYEDFAIGKMSREVVEAVKILIANRISTLDRLHISWFGGEPLLAKDICEEISSYAFDLCSRHGVVFTGGFTTNGYLLTRELAVKLIRIGQSHYQVSLDGDEEWHNRTRVQPNRKPTFERIWQNLLNLKSLNQDFNVVLRIHVHADNIDSVSRLYERVKEKFLDDRRFSVYFHRISNLSSSTQVNESVLNNDDYAAALTRISGPSKTVEGRPKSEIHLTDYICYAAKPNSLMIRATGAIGKCTVALDDDRNSIGRLLPDGTLEISNPKLRQWMIGFMDLTKATLACPLATLPKSIEESPLASPRRPINVAMIS